MDIDIARHVGAVSRDVGLRDHQGKPARVVVATRTYDTSAEDLWDALTNPERIPRWFLPISGELRPGGRYQLEGNAGGEITECEPPRHLAVTWEYGGGMSWVNVRLIADGDDATRLELEHIAHEDEHWEQFGPGAAGVGWEMALVGLDRYLAQGAEGSGVDPAEAAAWMGSANGKEFMRASSDGWRQAAVESGTDPAEAAEAAKRTTAFYTGESSEEADSEG